MNITVFAERCGVGAHTLRYYEKIGLMPPYHARPQWPSTVRRTRPPLEQIRHYAELRAAGDETVKARKELLQAHAHDLEQRIDAERHHLTKIRDKIRYYETL